MAEDLAEAEDPGLGAFLELERLRARVTELEGALSGRAAGVPLAGLMRRIAAGELTPTGEARPRRRLVGLSQESGISREEMARLGSRGHVGYRREQGSASYQRVVTPEVSLRTAYPPDATVHSLRKAIIGSALNARRVGK